MSSIVAADLFQPIEVDLWGLKCEVLEPTRAVERKLEAALDKADKLTEGDREPSSEELFDVEAELVDLVLEPVVAEGEKKVTAKAHLKKLYKADKIGRLHVERLYSKLADARQQQANPT